MDALMAHIAYDPETDRFNDTPDNQIKEIRALVTPFSPDSDPRLVKNIPDERSTRLDIFPDSGASICLGGLKHLSKMGLSVNNLIPSDKTVRAVGNFTMSCIGWIPVRFVQQVSFNFSLQS